MGLRHFAGNEPTAVARTWARQVIVEARAIAVSKRQIGAAARNITVEA